LSFRSIAPQISELRGVKNRPFPLTRHIAYTTACCYRTSRDHQCSFERCHPRPPTASSSPRLGVHNPHPKLQSLLSQERVKLRTSKSVRTFTGSIGTKALKNFGKSSSGRTQGLSKVFRTSIYRAHCAVIFR